MVKQSLEELLRVLVDTGGPGINIFHRGAGNQPYGASYAGYVGRGATIQEAVDEVVKAIWERNR